VAEHVHVLGEAGRLGNVLPPLANAVFTVPGVRVSAFYGEGGVRAAFLDRTSPTVGLGGGVLTQAGPFVLHVGYRYKELLNTGTLGTVLGLGQGLRTHEVRAGFGVRF
jgi:opacity protein-like surface antigen